MKTKTDFEIAEILTKSSDIREAMSNIYENKNPSSTAYRRVSKIMIEWNLFFTDGTNYIHPSLQEFYQQQKTIQK